MRVAVAYWQHADGSRENVDVFKKKISTLRPGCVFVFYALPLALIQNVDSAGCWRLLCPTVLQCWRFSVFSNQKASSKLRPTSSEAVLDADYS